MDKQQHSITSDITAQRNAALSTADTAPDREWRHNRHAAVYCSTNPAGTDERFVVVLLTPDSTALISNAGVLTLNVSRETMAAIVSDYDIVGHLS